MADLRDELQTTLGAAYTIERELPGGGMSRVFMAQERALGRRVVVKVLPPDLGTHVSVERFRREIQTVAPLQHPHIVPLLNAGQSGALLYYTMPLVEGETLRSRLDRDKRLPEREALQIAAEVADALGYAHRHGVVHRDIKPENILLTDGHALVTDFGVARALVEAGSEKLTSTGIVIGTPAYMSPEQVESASDIDARSDVYSLGVVLFEMLAGEAPFKAPSAGALLAKIVRDDVPSIRSVIPGIRSDVDALVKTATSRDRALRFENADEMRSMLVIASVPATVTVRVRRILWIAGVAAACIVVALVVLRWRLGGSHDGAGQTRWVLVADVAGPSDDAALAGVVREIAQTTIDQHKPLAAVSNSQLAEARRAALIPDSAPLTAERARHLAYRSAVRIVVEGRLDRVGTRNYSIVLRAMDAESGATMASQVAAASEEELMATTQQLATNLAKSLTSRRDTAATTRVYAAITPSLDAYRTFVQAEQKYGDKSAIEAVGLFRRAVEIDPEFALAWTELGDVYVNLGLGDSARWAFTRGMVSSQRLNPIQRLHLQGRLARASGDPTQALRFWDEAVAQDPTNALLYADRGLALRSLGRYEEAVESFRHSMANWPLGVPPSERETLSETLAALGRIGEAREVARPLEGFNRLDAEENIAVAEGDWIRVDSVDSQIERDAAVSALDRARAATAIASSHAARGHLGLAYQWIDRARTYGRGTGPYIAPIVLLIASGRNRGWDDVRTGALEKPGVIRGLWNALMGDTAAARREAALLRKRPGAIANEATFIEAGIAYRGRNWPAVTAAISEPARNGTIISTALARWLVADAYEKAGQPDSAAVYFDLVARATRVNPFEHLLGGMASSFAHRRLALLYAKMGRSDLSRAHWTTFRKNFATADSELAPLVGEAERALAAAR